MVDKEYRELINNLAKIIEDEFAEAVRLLQNCRIVLRHITNSVNYIYQETEIRIDRVMAWKILLILEKLDIKDSQKRTALNNILEDLQLKKAKNK